MKPSHVMLGVALLLAAIGIVRERMLGRLSGRQFFLVLLAWACFAVAFILNGLGK